MVGWHGRPLGYNPCEFGCWLQKWVGQMEEEGGGEGGARPSPVE